MTRGYFGGRPWTVGIDRRRFIKQSATTALGLTGTAALLSACQGAGAGTAYDIEIASPENPVRLDLYDDNPPIESGLEPEAGPLKIFNWADYIYLRVLKDFAAEYNVEFEVTTFHNVSEAVSKLRSGGFGFDIFVPTIDFLPRLVVAGMLQPLNHDYLPNLQANIWPEAANPFYDRGSRYTVPYVIYKTGIAWRTDLVDEDISQRPNPYDVFWDPQYKGRIGIYDDYREAISMVLLRNGITDINTSDGEALETAKQDLIEAIRVTNIRTTIDGAYSRIPEGTMSVHQSWSGDIIGAPYYMPEGGDPSVLRYWYPNGEIGVIGNDTIAIPKDAEHPVLAHHFMNYLMDNANATKNFSWLGYQPPISALKAESLVEDGLVLENLEPAIVTEADLTAGVRALALHPDVDALWLDVWAQFKSGA
jgi:spermidine/putrescine transport system substrate-binding protein